MDVEKDGCYWELVQGGHDEVEIFLEGKSVPLPFIQLDVLFVRVGHARTGHRCTLGGTESPFPFQHPQERRTISSVGSSMTSLLGLCRASAASRTASAIWPIGWRTVVS